MSANDYNIKIVTPANHGHSKERISTHMTVAELEWLVFESTETQLTIEPEVLGCTAPAARRSETSDLFHPFSARIIKDQRFNKLQFTF